jgi:hypothetical protein
MIQLIPSRGFAIVMRSRGPRGLEPVTSDSDQSNRISMKRYAVADVCPNPAPAIRKALLSGVFLVGWSHAVSCAPLPRVQLVHDCVSAAARD